MVEHFTQQGPWSYLPVPLFLTDGGFGWFRDAGENVRFAFEEDGNIRIESAAGPEMKEYLLTGTLAAQLRAYLQRTGDAVLPPEWAFGAVDQRQRLALRRGCGRTAFAAERA